MTADDASELSLFHLLQAIWRHKGKALACFVCVVGIAAVATLFWPKTYRSEGKLLVRLGRENMALDPTATLGATSVLAVQQTRENEINSIIEVIHSRVLIDKIVDAIGPEVILDTEPFRESPNDYAPGQRDISGVQKASYESSMEMVAAPREIGSDASSSGGAIRAAAIRRLIKSLNVEAARKSDVILITYDAPSPELAQGVVSRMIAFFLDEHIRLNRTPGAQAFLSKQTSDIRERLQAKENELRKLQDDTGLAEPQGQRTIVVNRIGRLEDDLLQVSTALSSAEAEVKQLKEQLESLPENQVTEQTVGMSNEAADGMRQQLYALQIREQELATKFTNDHPQLEQVRRQIAEAQVVLDHEQGSRTQTKTGPSKPYEAIKVQLLKAEPELAALRAKSERLQNQLKAETAARDKLNSDELQIARLQREVQLEEANYRKYSDSLEQARIDHAMAEGGKSNVSIVQPATFDLKPVKPNILMNLAAGVVLGALGGLGLALVAESKDDSIRHGDDLERYLDLPTLATLPRLHARQLQPLERVKLTDGART
jgi:polysaccharide biosynthesis protein PslE